jgi:hypothetical protein
MDAEEMMRFCKAHGAFHLNNDIADLLTMFPKRSSLTP